MRARNALTKQVFLATTVTLVALSTLAATRHPSLVEPAKAKCLTCHEEVLEGAVQHPPAADDCLSCHEFAREDGATTVALSAPGSELCVLCHDGMEAAAAGELEFPHAPAVDDCASCHQPHSSPRAHLLTAGVPALCFQCHDAADTDAAHGMPVSRRDCSACHDPHGTDSAAMLLGTTQHPPFAEGSCDSCHRKGLGTRLHLISSGADLCYACHSDLENRFSTGVVHTAVAEGRCVGCHDPHLASHPSLLVAAGNALCFPCHETIKDKATSDGAHAAVEEGCTTCHQPHNSDHPAVLVDAANPLCLACHDAEDATLRAIHIGADLTALQCTACHDPHGSSQPHLIADVSVHAPFAEGMCDSCHEGSADRLMEDGGSELCLACHSDVEARLASVSVPHAAMEMAACVACHSPHASAQASLVKAPAGGPCLDCHDDKGASDDEFLHGATAWFGCQACHEPHGGDRSNLLHDEASQLCLGCHSPAVAEAVRAGGEVELVGRLRVTADRVAEIRTIQLSRDGLHNHPVIGHRVLGVPTPEEIAHADTTFSGELGCLSCHDPHKGRSRQLFTNDLTGTSEVCEQCHVK